MVDSYDREKIGKARDELFRLLNVDEARDAALLVIANKQVIGTPGIRAIVVQRANKRLPRRDQFFEFHSRRIDDNYLAQFIQGYVLGT